MPEPIPTNRSARSAVGANSNVSRQAGARVVIGRARFDSNRVETWGVLLISIAAFLLHFWLSPKVKSSGGWPESWVYAVSHWPSAAAQEILIVASFVLLVWFAIFSRGFTAVPEEFRIPLNIAIGAALLSVVPIVLSVLIYLIFVALIVAALIVLIFVLGSVLKAAIEG